MASSQGLDHALQGEEFIPMNEGEEMYDSSDLAFIYDVFQNCWADSMNFYLVNRNKLRKDGRLVYLDAKNYFRGTAVKSCYPNQEYGPVTTNYSYNTKWSWDLTISSMIS